MANNLPRNTTVGVLHFS